MILASAAALWSLQPISDYFVLHLLETSVALQFYVRYSTVAELHATASRDRPSRRTPRFATRRFPSYLFRYVLDRLTLLKKQEAKSDK